MNTLTTALQMLVRLVGLGALVLGALFWSGNALNLIPLHMLLGITLILSLWGLALLAARAGVNSGLVALAALWGLLVPALGMTQGQLLPGSSHWVIQLLHLLVGVTAIGLGESLAGNIKRSRRLGGARA